MKTKKYEIIMDIYKGILNREAIEFTTEDNGNCELVFNIVENKVDAYDLTGCKVRMVIQGVQQGCEVVSALEGTVKISLMQSMFREPGIIYAELQIYDVTNQTLRLTTPRFRYTVRKSLMDDSTVEADPNFSILQDMIIEVSGAYDKAVIAEQKATEALEKINTGIPRIEQAATNAQEALDRALDVATSTELKNLITVRTTVPQDAIKGQLFFIRK